jgi:hypothetical protein
MLTQRQLLTVSAALECLAGLALMLAPGEAMKVLLGTEPDAAGLMLGPVAGVALAALGICCFWARTDTDGKAYSGTLRGITFYNAGVGLFLVYLAAIGRARGIVVWGAGALHLSLAALFLLERATSRGVMRR